MVLATREVPGIQLGHWAWLTVWTLIGGTLAAGSANAINCYLDRDIDELMTRTRRRPLPAHQVDPQRAVVFGLVLGAISFVVLAWFVNLRRGVPGAARDRVLRRRLHDDAEAHDAPEHRHRRGRRRAAAGHRLGGGDGQRRGPGAAPVRRSSSTGRRPTSGRCRSGSAKDYAAAGVPMLPVVRGIPETTRQIGLYTILHGRDLARALRRSPGWARSTSSRPCPRRAVPAPGLRALAARLSEEESTAGAIRLYKYSISYLTLLFAGDRGRRDRDDRRRLVPARPPAGRSRAQHRRRSRRIRSGDSARVAEIDLRRWRPTGTRPAAAMAAWSRSIVGCSCSYGPRSRTCGHDCPSSNRWTRRLRASISSTFGRPAAIASSSSASVA